MGRVTLASRAHDDCGFSFRHVKGHGRNGSRSLKPKDEGPCGPEVKTFGPFYFVPQRIKPRSLVVLLAPPSSHATIEPMTSTARLGILCGQTILLVACGDPLADPHHPGKALGTYHVDAKLEANTCGAGALGSKSEWPFDVKLSRDPGVIYWDNGAEVLPGTLASDDVTFSFTSGVLIDMRDASSPKGLPPCSISRSDAASGVLAADTTSFTGKLAYGFAPTQGSDCTDLVVSAMPVFAALPCGMTYTLTAARSEAP